jgi:tRNA G46 methylase TrmB
MMLHLLLQEEIASFCPNLRERDNINAVLDVACGPGWWVFAMAQAQRDVNFMGIATSIKKSGESVQIGFNILARRMKDPRVLSIARGTTNAHIRTRTRSYLEGVK